MGKTTTVLSTAHELLDEFLGAVCLVELGPLDSPFLASAITSAFRLAVRTQDPIPELATHLRGKRVLLVLDSCEHVIAEAARIAERLFREASDLYILATSREALQVEGEHIYLLPPLVAPPENEKLTAAEALAYPAVQLFVNRIVSAGFSNGLVDEEAQIVSGMCRQLGGIALAIELAADQGRPQSPGRLIYNPNELAAERKRVKAELAQIAAVSEIVTVHPAAIERYLADIRRLAEVAAEAAELGEPELVATLRQLVQAVAVHAPPGTNELAIEIKASLSELTLPGPLLKRSNGGGDRW